MSYKERREYLLDWMRSIDSRMGYPNGITAREAGELRIYESCVNGRYDTALRDLRALQAQGMVRCASYRRPMVFEIALEHP